MRLFFLTLMMNLVAVCLGCPAEAQSGLSQNSGINSADTWITATINVAGNGSVTLSAPAYNPVTQTTSATLPVSSSQSFNLEAGYDTNGGLVVNLYPVAPANPTTADASLVSGIRYAGGQMTVFDQSGNVIPIVMPNANIPVPSPLAFLGTTPGSSLISGIVVPQNIGSFPLLSTLTNGTVAYSQGGTVANLSGTPPSGGSAAWTYAAVGSNWVVQSVTLSTSIANANTARTFNFSNVAWSDNPAKDAARATTASTLMTPPSASTSNPPTSIAVPAPNAQYSINSSTISPTNCFTSEYNLGGPQNVVMVHGLNSSSCTWTRMANWLNQDFRFGTEIIPSLSANSSLSAQGSQLEGIVLGNQGNGYILMGHSQGGLASRKAAQYFQSNYPGLSAGVITIDSPNNGADFATNGFVAGGLLTAWGAASFAGRGASLGLRIGAAILHSWRSGAGQAYSPTSQQFSSRFRIWFRAADSSLL